MSFQRNRQLNSKQNIKELSKGLSKKKSKVSPIERSYTYTKKLKKYRRKAQENYWATSNGVEKKKITIWFINKLPIYFSEKFLAQLFRNCQKIEFSKNVPKKYPKKLLVKFNFELMEEFRLYFGIADGFLWEFPKKLQEFLKRHVEEILKRITEWNVQSNCQICLERNSRRNVQIKLKLPKNCQFFSKK